MLGLVPHSNQTKQESALPVLLRVPLRVAEVLVRLVASLVVTMGGPIPAPASVTVICTVQVPPGQLPVLVFQAPSSSLTLNLAQ